MTILITDDILYNRILIKEIAEKAGYTCIEAMNGKEAITIIEQTPVDLLLLDIEMPVMNGLETITYIRNHSNKKIKSMPVVALTAHNPSLFFNDHKEAKFNNILTKPYSPERVISMIKTYIPGQ